MWKEHNAWNAKNEGENEVAESTLVADAAAAADGGGRGARTPIPALASISTSASNESSTDGDNVDEFVNGAVDNDDEVDSGVAGAHRRARAHAASAVTRVRIAPHRAMARAWCGDSEYAAISTLPGADEDEDEEEDEGGGGD